MAAGISIEGADGVIKTLGELPANISATALRQLAQSIYDKAQQKADRHTKTGQLARSLYIHPVDGGRGWEIGHNLQHAPHALFVHWGTRPHTIRPKNRKALRWSAGNAFVFAKFVRHPGYKGDPWLIHAASEALQTFRAQHQG